FEMREYVKTSQKCDIVLPGQETIPGQIGESLDTMNTAAQTLNFVVRPVSPERLPENLIVRIRIIKQQKPMAVMLPKAAVLTDETQTSFWIMKLINDTTAVKVPVKKGITNMDKVEILAPPLSNTDRILLTGNYGLSDTATVKVMNSK